MYIDFCPLLFYSFCVPVSYFSFAVLRFPFRFCNCILFYCAIATPLTAATRL